MSECEHKNISFDDKPDYDGCHSMCMKWFGTCDDCGERLYELWSPQGIKPSKE